MKKIIIILLIVSSSTYILAGQSIDLNKASFSEIKQLPITEEQAQDIYNYRYYISFFESVYDLKEIPSIDQKTLNKLKPLVIISHISSKDQYAQRREEIQYILESLGNNEGLQEGISDIWQDYLITPRNLNKLTFNEITNFPNVNNQDALAVVRRIALGDTITSWRDLRNTEGITYYAAKKLSNFVTYEDPQYTKNLFVDYQLKFISAAYDGDEKDIYKESMIRFDTEPYTPRIKKQNYWGYFGLERNKEYFYNKLRLRYKNDLKAGVSWKKYFHEVYNNEITDNSKYYLKYDYSNELFSTKVIAGNFRASFGQGLVLESSDYYSPRLTGYGFNKRIIGLTEDLSQTDEYSLKGLAWQTDFEKFNLSLFFSSQKKDAFVYDTNLDNNAIIDNEDPLFAYASLKDKFSNEDLEIAEDFFNNYQNNENQIRIAPRQDAFTENLVGGHFEFLPIKGSSLGFTGYQANYDRDFIVPADTTRELLISSPDNYDKWKVTNSEISSLYSTKTENYDKDYRRVYGFDFETTIKNISIQGEFAELEKNGSFHKLGDDPKAFLIGSHILYENFYLLSIYRDYDLEFDNPYQRSFSENERFDDTVFDNLTYGLNNTLLSNMYNNGAKPSPEKGIYFETRYQLTRFLTVTEAYIDFWERKADKRRGVRFETKLNFRPIHQIIARFRYKYQLKRYDDDLDRHRSLASEFEPAFTFYLSNFDRLKLSYTYTSVEQPPYLSIFSDPAVPGDPDMAQAKTLDHGDMLTIDYNHNFNDHFEISGALSMWEAMGASFWDFEDVELDFDQSDRGYKYWFTFNSVISSNIYLSLKYKYKNFMTREVEYRQYNEIPDSGEYYFENVEKDETEFRLQIDFKY